MPSLASGAARWPLGGTSPAPTSRREQAPAHATPGAPTNLNTSGFALFLVKAFKELFKPDSLFWSVVEHESELRNTPQVQTVAYFVADIGRGRNETFQRPFLGGRISEYAHMNAGMLEVGAHIHTEHGRETDPRVLQLLRNHCRYFRPDLAR